MKKIIPVLLLLFFCTIPSHATVTVAHANSFTDISTSGTGPTVVSTTAHNSMIVYLDFRGGVSDTATSVTDAASDVCTQSGRSTSTAYNRAQEIWCCADISASQTSMIINYTTSGHTVAAGASEIHSSLGTMSCDGGAGSTNPTITSTWTGPSMTTTGSNDGVFSYCSVHGGTPSPQSPFSVSIANDGHGNPTAADLAVAAGSIAVTWTGMSAGDDGTRNTIAALKEPGGAATIVPRRGSVVIR